MTWVVILTFFCVGWVFGSLHARRRHEIALDRANRLRAAWTRQLQKEQQ